MKHIIFGGDGFLGTELTRQLIARNEKVLICASFAAVKAEPGDIVYHFAARLLVPILPREERQDYFWQALYVGTENVLKWMKVKQLNKMVYYTTDMVYGHTEFSPRTEDHPCKPLGPYGEAKYQTELLVDKYRQEEGYNITLFRPRLIIGHGRLGILEKLFKLIDWHLPVPTIGSGRNFYQFISVGDCARACIAAVEAGLPNGNYNLGSENPPTVNDLLKDLIKEAGSYSIVIPTPAFAVKGVLAMLDKFNKPIMDPEQYLIADETCILDCTKADRELNWRPQDSDTDMLKVAYLDYKDGNSRPS